MSEDSGRSVLEYERDQQRARDEYDRDARLREWIKACSRALERGAARHYRYVAHRLDEDLLPEFLPSETALSLWDGRVGDRPGWHWQALDRFRDRPEAYIQALDPGAGDTDAASRVNGVVGGPDAAARTIERAFRSVATVAEAEGVIREELKNRVPAEGFASKVGEHIQDPEDDFGDSVQLVTRASGALKTLFTGGTGQGKSAALETEAEDIYKRSLGEGRDYKLIDIVGTGDGENWFYDVPQQDDELRSAREEQGHPPDFTDGAFPNRDLEILVPLTPDLDTEQLPYDTEAGAFTVRPFTVPAAGIRKPLMIAMITAKLTDQQEAIVRDAYDEMSGDWALKDLATEIRSREELDPAKKRPVIRTLRQLQRHGFIRTHDSEYTIDWRAIFESTDTVTLFSQAFVGGRDGDAIARLIAMGYVIHTLVKERESMRDVPDCVLLMRELWTIAPHRRRQKRDRRAAQLQEAIGHMLAELFRVNRRRGIHILADTQQPSDLLKPVREMFNRYVVFNTDKDTVKDIYEWTASDDWYDFYRTLTPEPGIASVAGLSEPVITHHWAEFVGPVEYAPPGHHHFDEDRDFSGWHSRSIYLDREELRRPANVDGVLWPTDVPPELEITFDGTHTPASDGPDPVMAPVAAFATEALSTKRHDGMRRDNIKLAFNAWLRERGEAELEPWDFTDSGVQQRFGNRIAKFFDADDIPSQTRRQGDLAYKHVRLNDRGQALLASARDSALGLDGDLDRSDAGQASS